MNIRDMTLISLLTTILFVQETALSFIPSFQFTVFLLVLYTRLLSMKKVSVIILIHVVLDNLLMGSPIFIPFMFVAWMMIPILLNTILKRLKSPLSLALFGIFYASLYGLILMPVSMILFEFDVKTYVIYDIPYQLVMACSNFITILWLYDPLRKFLSHKLLEYGYSE